MTDLAFLIVTGVLGFAATAQAAVLLGNDRRESGLYSDRTAISVPLLLISALALLTLGVLAGHLTHAVGFGVAAIYVFRFIYRTVRGPAHSNF